MAKTKSTTEINDAPKLKLKKMDDIEYKKTDKEIKKEKTPPPSKEALSEKRQLLDRINLMMTRKGRR